MPSSVKGVACYPSNVDARRGRSERPEPPAWPAPEVSARLARLDEIPTGARRIIKLAHRHDWVTWTTYARGTLGDARGRPLRVVDDVMVKLGRDTQRAVACWTDGSFDFAYVGYVGADRSGTWIGPAAAKVNARDLRSFITRAVS